MSAIDVIESVRPEVDPLPLVERRMIREQLFGVGHGDVSRNITARSASGAVVSTAPRGTRALAAPRTSARGSLAKVGAGMLLLAALGAVGWSFLERDDDSVATGETPATTAAPTTQVPTTVAATTTAPVVRTGVSAIFPIALPPEELVVDSVDIAAPAPGSAAAIFQAPDDTNLWLAEIDGEPGNSEGLDVRQVGTIEVGTASDFVQGDSPSYQIQVPCGFVLLNDAPGRELFRPQLVALLESMSIDTGATMDIALPDGWSVVAVGSSVNTFTAQLQAARGDETVPVAVSQAPGGSIAQLTFGGRQLRPTTFLGKPAYLDAAPFVAGSTSVFWRDADTVFNVRSDRLGPPDLERLVGSFEAVEPVDWERRFDQQVPAAPVLESECRPQPSFGTSLDP